jgi:hypothetical protein
MEDTDNDHPFLKFERRKLNTDLSEEELEDSCRIEELQDEESNSYMDKSPIIRKGY